MVDTLLLQGRKARDGDGRGAVPRLRPKEGDKVKAGDKELTWKKYQAPEHYFDFNAFLGQQTEDSVGYAVCYLVSDAERPNVQMKTGSDDQAKVWLNGTEGFKNATARPTDKDQDSTDVTLKKGDTVLVVKVVNEKVDWSFCVRFTDKDDKPVAGLKAAAAK